MSFFFPTVDSFRCRVRVQTYYKGQLTILYFIQREMENHWRILIVEVIW